MSGYVQPAILPPTPNPDRPETQTRRRLPLWVPGAASALFAGAAMASCFWPLEWHRLAWVAMTPFLAILPRLRSDHAWLCGVLLALLYYRLGLSWLFGINGLLAGCALIILSVWMGFAFRVARLLMDRLGPGAMLWAVPLAFVGQEVLRCEAFPRLRFAFLALGYSQSQEPWIAQIASIAGVYGLSFIVVSVNAAVAWAIACRSRRALLPLAIEMVLVGGLATAARHTPGSADRIAVACVQAEDAGIPAYLVLTRQALEHPARPRIVVLPEHTITDDATDRHPLVQGLAALAATHDAYICVGAHVRPVHSGTCAYDNVGLLIGPQGILGTQDKVVPLPFFEDGNPAHRQVTFETRAGRLGILVCYDALFTDTTRRLVKKGAELLLVPVMDADRWPLQQRWQHARMAPIRSIEVRRASVRAASSGVTQIIDPAGGVVAQRTKEEGPGIASGHVALVGGETLFVRGGWAFAWLVGVAFLVLITILTLEDWCTRWRQWRAGRCPETRAVNGSRGAAQAPGQ